MSRNKFLFAAVLLFVVGVKIVKPLKCFSCIYIEGKGNPIIDKECKDLKKSDTGSKYLINCGSHRKSCIFSKTEVDSPSGKTTIFSRDCSTLDKSGCEHVNDEVSKLKSSGTNCFCKEDGCNRASDMTQSITLLALSVTWALTQAFQHLFSTHR